MSTLAHRHRVIFSLAVEHQSYKSILLSADIPSTCEEAALSLLANIGVGTQSDKEQTERQEQSIAADCLERLPTVEFLGLAFHNDMNDC